MKIKILVLTAMLILIAALSLFGYSFKYKLLQEMSKNNPEYLCNNGICTICTYKGEKCACNNSTCICGNNTINMDRCSLKI